MVSLLDLLEVLVELETLLIPHGLVGIDLGDREWDVLVAPLRNRRSFIVRIILSPIALNELKKLV